MNSPSKIEKKAGSAAFASDAARWQAVVAKDRRADDQFWFSVKTTGVYCRPSCSSRLAKRENVAFHPSPADAEKSGFRPCLKCDPKGPGLIARHAEAVAAACRIIRDSDEFPRLDKLARAVHLSPGYFHRLFKETTGLTPKDYAEAHRADRVKKALPKRKTVTEAIYEAGYNSNSRFYADATRTLGMKPKAYARGGLGVTLRYAVTRCSLGSLLVASSEQGVCAILLGDQPGALVASLQKSFAQATLIAGDASYARQITDVVNFIEAPQLGLHLPLDIRGTAFQQRVWQELQRIPLGHTASYAEVARRIGAPKSVRAVAQACGANTLAIAVPCHRVVASNGTLGGYRWGAKRKQALLKREGAAA